MNPQTPPPLAQQQQALLQALFARPGTARADAAEAQLMTLLDVRNDQARRGLAAYRANGHALAERALLAVYPVVAALIGGDNFALLARDLWHRYPPQRGDLAQWGDTLPAFLRSNEQLADTPYLSDVAHAEWALHRAAGAPDAVPDVCSFARLGSENPQGLALTLSPGTALVCSRHPVASLITAHLQATPTLGEAARRLREGQGEHALVWRQGLRPRITGVSAAAAALLQALLANADLPQALDAASAASEPGLGFDFSAWLTLAVTDSLVIGTHRLTPTPSNPSIPPQDRTP